jgi:hypothetical protein
MLCTRVINAQTFTVDMWFISGRVFYKNIYFLNEQEHSIDMVICTHAGSGLCPIGRVEGSQPARKSGRSVKKKKE